MKVLVASDLDLVRDKVAAACIAVDGLTADYISDRKTLEQRLQTDGKNIDIVLLDTSLSSFSRSGDILNVLTRYSDQTLAMLVPNGAGEGAARRYVLNGAKGVFPHGIEAETLGYALHAIKGVYSVWIGTIESGEPLSTDREKRLSERELQVLRGICDGLQNKEIAHGFEIQEVTVKMHVRAIIRKLAAKNRTHAAMIARDNGLVD